MEIHVLTFLLFCVFFDEEGFGDGDGDGGDTCCKLMEI
jgi:hypothetical protein